MLSLKGLKHFTEQHLERTVIHLIVFKMLNPFLELQDSINIHVNLFKTQVFSNMQDM